MKSELFKQEQPNGRNYPGYLAVFEGQDGSGKTTIMEAVGRILQARGFNIRIVEEFSKSVFGSYLLDSVSKDKFLRSRTEQPTFLTQVFAFLADWMYMTEYNILPALRSGAIVLKDRYVDSQIVCQIPTTLEVYSASSKKVRHWLEVITGVNPIKPNRVFYMEVVEDERVARISHRNRSFMEDKANDVSESDLKIFRARERLYMERILSDPYLYTVVENCDSIPMVSNKVASVICSDLEARKEDKIISGRVRA